MSNHYPEYQSLKLDWPAPRVLRVTISRGKMNALDFQLHQDLARIWRYINDDPQANAVILTGEGKAFSAGGDFEMEKRIIEDYQFRTAMWKDARDMVMNILECNKPIVSAINGPAAGGGAVGAILADVSIAAKSAKIVDGHTRMGVAAGDYSAILWPILCGMAKAKYYLMTCEPIYGEEAERIGLVSMCVPDDELQAKALEVATKLANSSPSAVRWTKYALNNWMRQNWPIFDTSLALEVLGFGGPDVKEGLAAHLEKRQPKFDPDSPV
ncbi:MAG: enoyl-CoA hydratase/isomerase family protein [Pseudomonadota bacterium]